MVVTGLPIASTYGRNRKPDSRHRTKAAQLEFIMQAISTVVTVHDHPGNGGAHHHYRISEADASGETCGPAGKFARIMFQNGPIGEVGVNGCTNEDLLGVVAHRLACFQAGSFACVENAVALQNVGAALDWLQRRTQARQLQGVEGSNLQHVATGALIDPMERVTDVPPMTNEQMRAVMDSMPVADVKPAEMTYEADIRPMESMVTLGDQPTAA